MCSLWSENMTILNYAFFSFQLSMLLILSAPSDNSEYTILNDMYHTQSQLILIGGKQILACFLALSWEQLWWNTKCNWNICCKSVNTFTHGGQIWSGLEARTYKICGSNHSTITKSTSRLACLLYYLYSSQYSNWQHAGWPTFQIPEQAQFSLSNTVCLNHLSGYIIPWKGNFMEGKSCVFHKISSMAICFSLQAENRI